MGALDKITPAQRKQLGMILANPDVIDAELAERSLHEFIRQLWHEVEPGPQFIDNWHVGAMCEHLTDVANGKTQRLIMNVPPRHQKSLTCNVFYPAWIWLQRRNPHTPLRGPHVNFLYATYSFDLTIRDSVKCRELIRSETYQKRWGDRWQVTDNQDAKHRFKNTAGGERLASSTGGKITGEGGNIIVMDDPHNTVDNESDDVREEVLRWWRETMSNRLNNPAQDAFILIMQRLHQRDLSGYLLEQGGWETVCLPSRFESDHPHVYIGDTRKREGQLLWPDRFPKQYIDGQEATLLEYGFAGQHQQRPAPRAGGMFRKDKWEIVERSEVPEGGNTVRGWDLAGTAKPKGKSSRAAWTVGGKMRHVDGVFYILDVLRFRGSPKTVETKVLETTQADGYEVIIDLPQDPGQAGKAQAQYLVSKLAGYNVRYGLESGAKETRAEAMSAQQEAGNIKLVRAEWNEKFIDEATYFPNGRWTDQIDATSRAFHRLLGTGLRTVSMVAPEIIDIEAA